MTDARTVPAKKTELLAHTERRWQAFVSYIDALSDAKWTDPTDGAGWSVKDHVAHIVSWVRSEIALLQYRTPLQKSAGISDAAWKSGEFESINEEVRRKTIGDSPATTRDERDRVYRKLVETVSSLSDEDLARPATDFGLGKPGKSLLTVLTERHGDHFEEHRRHIEIIVACD